MRVELTAFILPHVGDEYSQCADRFSYDEANMSFAIADGVGNSLFPGDWAKLLCDDFVKHPDMFTEDSKLIREHELIEKWERNRDSRVENLSEDEKFIFEMGLSKADFAASTFIGLTLSKNGWECQAIGDSYLFVLGKDYELINKVASMDGKDFDNYPEYFASKVGQHNGTIIKREGDYKGVTCFALMTDALSDWFLSDATNQSSKKQLLSILNHQDFEKFINNERQMGNLKDDDTTMLVLKIIQDGKEELILEKKTVDKIDDLLEKQDEFLDDDKHYSDDRNDEISSLSIEQIKKECLTILSVNGNSNDCKTKRHIKKLVHNILDLLK